MQEPKCKPRLIFFQNQYDDRIPPFLLAHKREHVKCLAQFFDVTVINEDADYRQICERFAPDLTLFESGVPFASCRRPKLINTDAHAHVPKVGFLNADAFCCGRSGFLSDMDHWGIETFFAIATAAAENMPSIAANLFVMPNFVDDEIYHDYGQWKNVPVLFTGNKAALYPWRKAVLHRVSGIIPSLICPHFGYAPQKAARQVSVGEEYARLLNASWFVPACGTVVREVVRKHFEVPACKACLVTERTPMLEAAGFADMVNCVFAEPDNVLDKLDSLFRNPDQLREIIDAGHDLVHSRHTLRHRDQLLQWFLLRQKLAPGQRIVQPSPFGPMRIAGDSSKRDGAGITSGALHLRLLREGDGCLWRGKYDEAERLYLKCTHFIPYMPEPQLRLALCNLYKGNAKLALSFVVKPLEFTLAEYHAVDPDPVEWAYMILALICLGRVDESVERGRAFEWLRHSELDRARWVAKVLQNRESNPTVCEEAGPGGRASLHQLPARTLLEWVREVCVMLCACGRPEWAQVLIWALSRRSPIGPNRDACDATKNSPRSRARHTKVARKSADVQIFRRRLAFTKLRGAVRSWLRQTLHRCEARFGYFLPYRISERRNDEYFGLVQELLREERITTALIAGARQGEACTDAALAGLAENGDQPSVFCLSASRRWRLKTGKVGADSGRRGWFELAPPGRADAADTLRRTIRTIKEANHVEAFDAVVIDASELSLEIDISGSLYEEICAARFVILEDINTPEAHNAYSSLLTNTAYVLLDHNPDLRKGYAIFAKDDGAANSFETPAGAEWVGKTAGLID